MAKQHPYSLAFARAAVAVVWLYQGLWCKLLSGCPPHAVIVSLLPAPVGNIARSFVMGIGAIEVALAVWILSGWKTRLAAWTQTILLLVMNAGGLIWGRAAIADPAVTVINSLVLLALAWIIADDRI